jgi:hypothetical protein
MRVTVKGLHVTLTLNEGSVFEFDCSLKELPNHFAAAQVRILGHNDRPYWLPQMVVETPFANVLTKGIKPINSYYKRTDLVYNLDSDWFKEMIDKLIVESLKT